MFLEGENKSVEYKLEYSKTILKTVCAFANFHDGIIVLGIRDDGTIVGVDKIDEIKLNIENAINDAIIPKPYYEFEVHLVKALKLLVIRVYKGDYTPYTYQNKAYMRRDTSTVQVDATMNQNLILAGRNLGFEDLISAEQSLTFDYFKQLMRKQLKITTLSEDLLKTLGLIDNNQYNNAAALISDENPLKSSVVQLIAFSDATVNRIKDKATLDSYSLLQQFDKCMSFYRKHINMGEIIDSAYRKTVEDVPIIAYREAVANMLVHRDYSVAVDARIEIFSDRIEVISPGGLPIGLLNEEFIEGRISKARNRKIADLFLRLKIIEKLATGIRRIKEQYMDQDVKPQFLTSENAVVIILPFMKQSKKAHFNVSFVKEDSFEGKENEIYRIIRQNPMIKRVTIQSLINLEKSQTIELINKLRAAGKIIKVGNGPATGYKILE
ncbi:RNA-binding domain-containing protein [Fusibacter sp. 3D3]|uniref:RNA-binding domain-containing protein n=1 Tax=Fusibacter sp. 3D3 TaxID=1048380 RepID=UPI000853740C|nr:RNA-binding domain-containing protein [Fusibacter sp. 3D3]GAU78342.1 ATP-dependent DNA helicase [Fusibacter sp. 3D3]